MYFKNQVKIIHIPIAPYKKTGNNDHLIKSVSFTLQEVKTKKLIEPKITAGKNNPASFTT
jgi:hypothetical protein